MTLEKMLTTHKPKDLVYPIQENGFKNFYQNLNTFFDSLQAHMLQELQTFASCNQGDFVPQLGRELEFHIQDNYRKKVFIKGRFQSCWIKT